MADLELPPEMPPDMPNGIDDDDVDVDNEEEEDDDDDGYDLTGLSSKLHSIPAETLLADKPKEIVIGGETGVSGITLDGMGRPKGFDPEAVMKHVNRAAAAVPAEENGEPAETNGADIPDVTPVPVADDAEHTSGEAITREDAKEVPAKDSPDVNSQRSGLPVNEIKSPGEVEFASAERAEDPITMQEQTETASSEEPLEAASPQKQPPVENVTVVGGDVGDDDDFGDFDSAFRSSEATHGSPAVALGGDGDVFGVSDGGGQVPAASESGPVSDWSADFQSADSAAGIPVKEVDGDDEFGDFEESSAPSVTSQQSEPSLESMKQILDEVFSTLRRTYIRQFFIGQIVPFSAPAKDLECDREPLPVGLPRRRRKWRGRRKRHFVCVCVELVQR